MPRRRKHRKHGKGKSKKSQTKNKSLNLSTTLVNSSAPEITTPIHATRAAKLDSFELETPIRRISSKEKIENPNNNPFNCTPINRRRSLNRQNEAWNITNINLLFDANDVTLTENKIRRRSASLNSPVSGQTHKNTQAINGEDCEQEKLNTIMETPKMNNTKNLQNLKINNMNEININPYLREREAINLDLITQKSVWQKEKSVEELSFFSPQLFEKRTSSTPIEGRRLGHLNGRRESVNFYTPPLPDKVLNKDKSNSIRLLGSNKRKKQSNSTNKILNRTSPKISRLVNHSRILNKNLAYSRLSLDDSGEVLRSPTLRLGMYEKLISKIKRYSNASAKWSSKMMDACAQLGIQIKNSLTSLCHLQNSTLDCTEHQCRCEEYRLEIQTLNVKIGILNEELLDLRRQIGETSKSGDVELFREEISKMKQELCAVKDLRSELTALKDQFQCMRNSPLVPPPTTPTVRLPPPPPPPPPPMPLLQQPKPTLPKKSKGTLGTAAAKGDSRPVISLDEILKVKLRKTSDRASYTFTPSRRNRTSSTSVIPDDLVRQVKLRSALLTPTVSGGSPSTTTSSEPLSTSPASSLNRFLDSVGRVKRLRRVGGYSCDSVYRRTPISGMGRWTDRADS